ncbi:hypothetical protein E2C01_038648 [Portunus trituberculatus]|uniref:Uncharacterized protein n=1 Tax=Portunus trituberculatus TaxID=210409 RepID=A0A5B7FHR0_PORTR|nr:hypothetical protein [Portunus trituberculatus]
MKPRNPQTRGGAEGQFIMDGKPTKIIINERRDEDGQAALRHSQTRGCVPRYFMHFGLSVEHRIYDFLSGAAREVCGYMDGASDKFRFCKLCREVYRGALSDAAAVWVNPEVTGRVPYCGSAPSGTAQ